jgi:hypothetical protein
MTTAKPWVVGSSPTWGTISHNWEPRPPHLTGKSATASSMVMVSDSALWCC